jgi:hypothetical protein
MRSVLYFIVPGECADGKWQFARCPWFMSEAKSIGKCRMNVQSAAAYDMCMIGTMPTNGTYGRVPWRRRDVAVKGSDLQCRMCAAPHFAVESSAFGSGPCAWTTG